METFRDISTKTSLNVTFQKLLSLSRFLTRMPAGVIILCVGHRPSGDVHTYTLICSL